MMSATYLPDVAGEQGWTKVEAIDSAIRKGLSPLPLRFKEERPFLLVLTSLSFETAGWRGSITPALRSSLIIERYQSSKFTATYQDWKEWRAQLGFPL
jgi:hypothetical protein